MILETIRNWFGWRRKIPDPFLTVTIPRGVTHLTYTIGKGGGGGGSAGSGFSRDDSGGGRGGGRGSDPIVVKYYDSTMWPADDDSG
jgi:hypothetical protein